MSADNIILIKRYVLPLREKGSDRLIFFLTFVPLYANMADVCRTVRFKVPFRTPKLASNVLGGAICTLLLQQVVNSIK